MSWYCKLIGHTYTYNTENPRVSWNAGKDMAQLHITTEGEPKYWLECRRCGTRIESPTKEQIKRAGCNERSA